MVGAYGISGGTSQQDEEMAIYARAKTGWAAAPEHDTTDPEVKAHINALYAKAGGCSIPMRQHFMRLLCSPTASFEIFRSIA